MLKRFCLVLLLVVLVSGAAAAQDSGSESFTTSGYEILRVLSYGLGVFEPGLWRVAYAEEASGDTSVLWRFREQEENLFFFVHLYFAGELTPERIEAYYSAETFEEILVNYVPYEQTGFCRAGDLWLYEFRSKHDNENRVLRYWVRQVGTSTTLGVNGVANLADLALLDAYALRLFPTLPACDRG